MSEKKTLLTERMPAPPVMASVPVRERVLLHWKKLVTGGAVATLAGCGCLVMDPLPPPAACRTTDHILASLSLEALVADGKAVLRIYDYELENRSGLSLAVTGVDGGQVDSSALKPWAVTIRPDSPTSIITVTIAATCAGQPGARLRVVMTPASADGGALTGYSVAATESLDAGP